MASIRLFLRCGLAEDGEVLGDDSQDPDALARAFEYAACDRSPPEAPSQWRPAGPSTPATAREPEVPSSGAPTPEAAVVDPVLVGKWKGSLPEHHAEFSFRIRPDGTFRSRSVTKVPADSPQMAGCTVKVRISGSFTTANKQIPRPTLKKHSITTTGCKDEKANKAKAPLDEAKLAETSKLYPASYVAASGKATLKYANGMTLILTKQ